MTSLRKPGGPLLPTLPAKPSVTTNKPQDPVVRPARRPDVFEIAPATATQKAETIPEKRERLKSQIDAVKKALAQSYGPGLGVPNLFDRQPLSLENLQKVRSTLDSVKDPRDRSFIISELSDNELHQLGSATGELRPGPGLPDIPIGKGPDPQIAAEYRKLFETLGNSVDGYQAGRILKQLPASRRADFEESFAERAAPQYRRELADSVAGETELDAETRRSTLHRLYAQSTPAERNALLENSKVQAFASEYVANHKSQVGSGPVTTEDLLRGDRVGLRATQSPQEAAILAGDQRAAHHIDTPFEKKLLKKWLYGDGSPYVMSKDELATVQKNPSVVEVTNSLSSSKLGPHVGDTARLKLKDGSNVTLTRVQLADGSIGARADMMFTNQKNLLDGSIGKGRVYFDAKNQPVGILDSYDFSNKNLAVDGVNLAGSTTGARNFMVTGGLVEKSPQLDVPQAPQTLSSFGKLAEDVSSRMLDKAKAGASWLRRHIPFPG
jgi:hypothetical protein